MNRKYSCPSQHLCLYQKLQVCQHAIATVCFRKQVAWPRFVDIYWSCRCRWQVVLAWWPLASLSTWLVVVHLSKRITISSKEHRHTHKHREIPAKQKHRAREILAMAVISTVHQPCVLANQTLRGNRLQKNAVACSPRATTFTVRAAKLPAGVQVPRVQPKLSEPFLGFTNTAEVWNSRACMMGLIGTFIVELILNKGVLEIIGFEVGKGLDIPL